MSPLHPPSHADQGAHHPPTPLAPAHARDCRLWPYPAWMQPALVFTPSLLAFSPPVFGLPRVSGHPGLFAIQTQRLHTRGPNPRGPRTMFDQSQNMRVMRLPRSLWPAHLYRDTNATPPRISANRVAEKAKTRLIQAQGLPRARYCIAPQQTDRGIEPLTCHRPSAHLQIRQYKVCGRAGAPCPLSLCPVVFIVPY